MHHLCDIGECLLVEHILGVVDVVHDLKQVEPLHLLVFRIIALCAASMHKVPLDMTDVCSQHARLYALQTDKVLQSR